MNRHALGCLLEVVETLVLTLVIFLIVQTFVAQPYQIEQMSMENTLMPNQYVLVDKLSPHFDSYHRGDIIVFNPPPAWTRGTSSAPYIKRVIGVGGDVVDIHGGKVFINGTPLTEAYLYENQPTETTSDPTVHSWKVPNGMLFVMGDHRANSQDSRAFGPIEVSTVIGRAWLRYWPLDAFGGLPSPDYPQLSPPPSPTPSPHPPTHTPAPTPTR